MPDTPQNGGMSNMSRMATAEYVGAKRRAYAEAFSAKRTRLLDEVCETTGIPGSTRTAC